MSTLADVVSAEVPAVKTSWQLFSSLANGSFMPGAIWHKPSFRRKFVLRSLAMPIYTTRLLSSLAATPDLLPLLNAHPGLPCRLHRPWLSLIFDRKMTLSALEHHYKTFFAHMPAALRTNFLAPQGITLVDLTGKNGEHYTIRLLADSKLDKEGEVTLSFCDAQRTSLAGMTFALCMYQGKRTLFIGGLQGAKTDVSHDAIHAATKACHGLFPKRLLLEACNEVAARLQTEQIIAVSNSKHIYQSWRYRRKKQAMLYADYDSFWCSLGGKQTEEAVFSLPLYIPRKPMEEIASKKRAEYRRRYELLDSLQSQIAHSWRS